eukprot:537485_1
MQPTLNPTMQPTNNPFSAIIDSLPKPGKFFEFDYQNQTQNMTLNINVTYFNPSTTLQCIIEFDEDGKLDSNVSYIQILDDYQHIVYVDSILLATHGMFDTMHINCTRAPALMITKIINDTNTGILTLYIREAEIFEYIDELDCNITNGTLIDSGIDIGEIQKIKKMADYFTHGTSNIDENGTETNITFSNITYTEMEPICYNISVMDNGTEIILNTIPMINGICDDLSVIDYFGQKYGIDSLQFGGVTLNGNDTQFGIPNNDNIYRHRRRLGFFSWVKKIVNKAVKKFTNFVRDIIDLLKGDINKRVSLGSLSIDASKTYTISGTEDTVISKTFGKGLSGSVSGNFDINSGVEFHSSLYVDFTAKYKIFSKSPSFDMFRLALVSETRLKTYIDITVDGIVNIEYEIGRTEKRYVFFIGPIPIVVKPYASISFGVKADTYLNFMIEFGYKPVQVEYGIEWDKYNGWQTINKPLLLEPYKSFGSDLNNNGQKCMEFSIAPYITIQLGVVFYEIVDVSLRPTITVISAFQYPSTCDSINQCDHSPFHANFGVKLKFSVSIGLKVGVPFKTNLPSITKIFELPFNIPTVTLFDQCFATNILSFIVDSCCDVFYEMSFDQGLEDWNIVLGTGSNIELESKNCPKGIGSICWDLYVHRQMTGLKVSTNISTIGYRSIRILIDINSIGIDILCWIEYFNNDYQGYEKLAQNEVVRYTPVGNGPFLDREILLPNTFDNAPSITIILGASGGATGNDHCYFDNMRIFGIAY